MEMFELLQVIMVYAAVGALSLLCYILDRRVTRLEKLLERFQDVEGK